MAVSRTARSAEILAELTAPTAASGRFIDIAVSIRLADVEGEGDSARWRSETDEELVLLGGRWDRRGKRWYGEADSVVVLRLHRGQEKAARWLAEWLRRMALGDWRGFERVWSALLIGGRRSGKTHLAMVALVAFAVMSPAAIIWTVSPTLEAGAELDRALQALMPRAWYRRRSAKTGASLTFTLANGAEIRLRSGHKVAGLRAGRADLALLNEAQMVDHRAYVNLRGAVADRGGLCLVCANPPDEPRGAWVARLWNDASGKVIDAVAFQLDPRENPMIEYSALEALAREVDEKTYQRDVLGHFAPIGDVVFHAWDDRESWRDPPAELVDVTAEVTRREFGRPFAFIAGMDFQRIPACVGVVLRLFRDPSRPDAGTIAWIVDEVALDDEADENALLDVLEAIPAWRPGDGAPERRTHEERYRGWPEPGDRSVAHGCIVSDASGRWQDAAHTPRRTSEEWLRKRRWSSIFHPLKDSERNPPVIERCRAGNAALKAADGVRRLFVARHCVRTAEAMRAWPIKHGIPDRRSPYAHLADAVTYPVFRLFGRPAKERTGRLEYRSVVTFDRSTKMGGGLW